MVQNDGHVLLCSASSLVTVGKQAGRAGRQAGRHGRQAGREGRQAGRAGQAGQGRQGRQGWLGWAGWLAGRRMCLGLLLKAGILEACGVTSTYLSIPCIS